MGALFDPEAFEQLPGQMSFEQQSVEPETWRVTIATDHGASYVYPEARSAAAAVVGANHDRGVLLAGRGDRRGGARSLMAAKTRGSAATTRQRKVTCPECGSRSGWLARGCKSGCRRARAAARCVPSRRRTWRCVG